MLTPPLALFDACISVSELNRLARYALESALPPVWVTGEISNLTLAGSGHAYFSLKDGGAQIRAVMFRGRMAGLPFRLREGMQVEALGQVSLYEARGDYQINVDMLREAGLGQRHAALAQLKARLLAEGLFDAARKRPVPRFPRAIGVVTSPQGAALRDVVTTLRRRFPAADVVLYPTPVQGDTAPAQIAAAIRTASQRAEVDTLLVCRGGGSIEDLWAFNDEQVVRAVAACGLPVISGVGHETDTTLTDFAADCRAPTPTGAAELACPDTAMLSAGLRQSQQQLSRALRRVVQGQQQRLDGVAGRLVSPRALLRQQHQQLAMLQQRLPRAMAGTMAARRGQLAQQRAALERSRPVLFAGRRALLATRAAQLAALNPLAVLQRGYAVVENRRGQVIHQPAALKHGERVTLRWATGSTEADIYHPDGGQGVLPLHD